MKISVVIPTYNRAKIIKKSIQSVLNQTQQPFEIIIVDDFSTDDTALVVKNLNNDKIKYTLNQFSKGANGARNTGVVIAKGDYIAFQDSDDVWVPEKLEVQSKFMENHPEVDLNFCSLEIKNNNIKVVPRKNVKDEEIHQLLCRGNFISTQTIFMKAKIAKKELFDEKLKRFQDWDFALRVSRKYVVHHINKVLVKAEVQEDSISTNTNGLIAIYDLFQKHEILTNHSFANKSLYNKALYYKFKSVQCFIKYIFFKLLEIIFLERKSL